jgi:hypothetical protein
VYPSDYTPSGSVGAFGLAVVIKVNEPLTELMAGTFKRTDRFSTDNIITGGEDEQINVHQ